MQDRVKTLEGVRNFRDFGGYASRFGGAVKPGLLFRSGHYGEATTSDLKTLDTFGIAFQVDLRRPDERERMVGKWPGDAVRVLTDDGGREHDAPHHKFLEQVEADAEKADNWMNDYYKAAPFKDHHIALYSGWFDALANLGEAEAALVNCAAGKDRTGILCALTHHVLGVSEEDIFADYELTNTAAKVEDRIDDARKYFNHHIGKNYGNEVYKPFLGVRERYLRTALATIQAEAGSVDTYLTDALDVSHDMQDAMRARLDWLSLAPQHRSHIADFYRAALFIHKACAHAPAAFGGEADRRFAIV